jgi:hypothetical protein
MNTESLWSKILTWSEFWAWSEVWALLIPLTIFFLKRNSITGILKPVVYYLFIAFVLNFIADFIWRFQSPTRLDLPEWLQNNIPVYHIHAIARLILFAWFFNLLKEPFLVKIKKYIPYVFLLFVLLNYTVIKSPRSFLIEYSSELHAAEAAILLFYCLQHYVYLAQAEQIFYPNRRSVAWIVAGLTIYVGVNFFIFLFYSVLMSVSEQFQQFAEDIWEVHNVSYVLLCCFIAKGLYESTKS